MVQFLRSKGHDVVHLLDQGLERLSDHDIFAKAIHEKRIVLTFDLDFGEIVAFAVANVTSVIIFRLPHARAFYVIERLSAVMNEIERELRLGVVVTVEANRFRVRQLPFSTDTNK